MSGERTPTGNALLTYAEAVDATTSWQFYGAKGSVDENTFIAWAASKGPVPIVTENNFDDLADRVTVIAAEEPNEELGPVRIHLGTLRR